MSTQHWWLVLYVAIGAAAMMAALHGLQRRIGNAGVVDVGWAFGLGAAAIVYAVFADGEPARRVMLGVIGGVWGWRLAWHLLTDRVLGGAEEDGRYAALREVWGGSFQAKLFWFFQAQALLIVILSAPFVLAATDARPWPSVFDITGGALWLLGVAGESIADYQLKRFKRRTDSRGKTCREGLWRYSRHPNYFFEWMIWLGFGVFALGAEFGWVGLLAPTLMLLLIVKVTGIPPTEARALRSRGDDYRRYQRETSAFVPWFPKKGAR